MIPNVVRSWWSRFTHICPAPPLDETPLTTDAPDPDDVGQQWTCDCGRSYVTERAGWVEVPYERRIVPDWDTFLGIQLQRAWFCECDRAYYWAKPAVWKRCGRQYLAVSFLAGLRDMLIPSGGEPTYVLNGWTCDCGREYERAAGDLLCCDWVTTADWTPVFTADPEPPDGAVDRDDDWPADDSGDKSVAS